MSRAAHNAVIPAKAGARLLFCDLLAWTRRQGQASTGPSLGRRPKEHGGMIFGRTCKKARELAVVVVRPVIAANLISGALVFACAVGAIAGAASADDRGPLKPVVPTGSRIAREAEEIKGRRLNQFFDNMARCVVNRAPAKADYFLRMSDDFGMSDAVGDVTEFLPLVSCVGDSADVASLGTQARFTPMALRNWLSEKAYLEQHKQFTAVAADAPPVPERSYYSRAGVMKGQAYGIFSDCIVKEDALAADALVRTQRGSPDERAAAAALVPAMSACLPDGQTLTLDQQIIRGLAAQGLWQRYEAPKPVQYKAKR